LCCSFYFVVPECLYYNLSWLFFSNSAFPKISLLLIAFYFLPLSLYGQSHVFSLFLVHALIFSDTLFSLTKAFLILHTFKKLFTIKKLPAKAGSFFS